MILRLAHRLSADYEWDQHIVRGRARGLDDRRIRALGRAPEDMDPDDALLARAVDALVDGARLPPDLLGPLGARLGKSGVLDLMAMVGLYTTIAYIVRSFDVPLDADVAAELERRPLG